MTPKHVSVISCLPSMNDLSRSKKSNQKKPKSKFLMYLKKLNFKLKYLLTPLQSRIEDPLKRL